MSDELLIGITNKTSYQAIADAIRTKGGSDTYTPSEMAAAILELPSESIPAPEPSSPELQDKTFTENGTYTADSEYDGLGTVTVDVEIPKLYSSTIEVYIYYFGDNTGDVFYIPVLYNPNKKPPINYDGAIGELHWLGEILKDQSSVFALHSSLHSSGYPSYNRVDSNNAVQMIKVANYDEGYNKFSNIVDKTGLFYYIVEENGYSIPYFHDNRAVKYEAFGGGYGVEIRELNLQEIDLRTLEALSPTAVSDFDNL